MGLFFNKKTVGMMRLDFLSHNEVFVNDGIPNGPEEIYYPIWFAFLCVGKLLFNFPNDSGRKIVKRGLSNLGGKVNEDNPLIYNESMLGICCERPIIIVSSSQKQAVPKLIMGFGNSIGERRYGVTITSKGSKP